MANRPRGFLAAANVGRDPSRCPQFMLLRYIRRPRDGLGLPGGLIGRVGFMGGLVPKSEGS